MEKVREYFSGPPISWMFARIFLRYLFTTGLLCGQLVGQDGRVAGWLSHSPPVEDKRSIANLSLCHVLPYGNIICKYFYVPYVTRTGDLESRIRTHMRSAWGSLHRVRKEELLAGAAGC